MNTQQIYETASELLDGEVFDMEQDHGLYDSNRDRAINQAHEWR
jgi:hypothetical protein